MKLKVLKLTNPETKQEVIRPRVVSEGKFYPVLKPQGDKTFLKTIERILNGSLGLDDLKEMHHEEYGTYYLVSSIEEITSMEDLDKSLV